MKVGNVLNVLPFTLYILFFCVLLFLFFLFFKVKYLQCSCCFSLTLPGPLTHNLCVTSAGLPGRHGGCVLWRRGGRALPLPLLLPGSLCLHRHAVCHPPGLETDRLQVSERPPFSRPAFSNCFGGKKMPEWRRVIYRRVQVSHPRARACFLGRLFSFLFLPIPFNQRLHLSS